MVSTAAFHARVRGSVAGLGGFKETKMFLPHPRVKVSIVGSLRDRKVACSASDRQGSNFESCVWRTVSSQSSHHPQEVLLAQFSLYVHKGGLKPDSFHFIYKYNYSSRDWSFLACCYNTSFSIPTSLRNLPTRSGQLFYIIPDDVPVQIKTLLFSLLSDILINRWYCLVISTRCLHNGGMRPMSPLAAAVGACWPSPR